MMALANLILQTLLFSRFMPKVADLACGKPGDKHLSHHIPRGKSEIRVVTSRVKEKIHTHTNGFIGQTQNIKVIPESVLS